MENQKNKQESKLKNELLSWLKAFAFAFAVLILLRLLGFDFRQVNGSSMYPTLEDKDRVIISNFFYTPHQGDIVVFTKDYRGHKKSFVKRVIATGGDQVDIDFHTGEVFVNEIEITEELSGQELFVKGDFTYPMTIPEGHIFVLGDNRNNSEDSRFMEVGPVPLDNVDGKLVFRMLPLRRIGTVK